VSPRSPDITASATIASIRRFLQRPETIERCALCGAALAAEHPHLVELASRRLRCACPACALLFGGTGELRYRRVPDRVRLIDDLVLDDATWDALQLPINLAFFVRSTPLGQVLALYPSPAGATESLVAAEAWSSLEAANPALREIEPDVEGLLVNRVGTAREAYRAGLDVCYRLVGLIRKHWRGLSGGPAVWGAVTGFFDELRVRSD
jgi:hypothetical protein